MLIFGLASAIAFSLLLLDWVWRLVSLDWQGDVASIVYIISISAIGAALGLFVVWRSLQWYRRADRT